MSHIDNADVSTQVLMLGLGGEVFALGANMVREIIDPVPTTRVTGAKPHLASLINVRGNVIPLADLRVRFGMSCRENTAETRIVVIELATDDQPIVVGIVADKVYEVTELSEASMQQTPRVGMRWRPEYIRAVAKWNDDFIIVPDLVNILN